MMLWYNIDHCVLYKGNIMFFKEEIFFHSSELVRSFASTHYPNLPLHPKMVEQLSWLQNNSVNTSQSNVNLPKTSINIEVKRALSRLNALTLLIEGGSLAHAAFVQSQLKDVLSEKNFNHLSHFIQELSLISRKCLMATCFITKSDQVINKVPEEKRNELPADSEQFITYIVTYFPKLYPICALLDHESIALLKYAFYKNAHARQILDMEGGYNMVSGMAEAIRLRTITYEQYNLWFARWIINVAGLDGHVNHQGSIYLTEPVANCIWALKLELDQLWINSNHQVIDNYLVFRKKQLEVNDIYTAYLGALMRQYQPKIGRDIMAWFENLSADERQKKIKMFQLQLTSTKVTPTFKPTVLVGLLELGCSISYALTIFTEIESQTMQIYMNAIANDRMSSSTPLSYRSLALKDCLIAIKDYYDRYHTLPEFTINSGGYLGVATGALEEKVSLGRYEKNSIISVVSC
ncbi:MAG TPA: hypothetical protein VHD33_02455 [Legionellaceae bacterium]|nr:hypothetical protein [Legionellaceae bacterium]